MKTKHGLFVLACSLFSLAGFSQIGKTTFGLRAGVNFQNLNGDDYNGDDLDNKIKTGFHIGANAEIPIAKDFYIQPGVLFSTKGARHDNFIGGNDLKVNLSYIEIPVNLLYKPVLGPGKLLLGFGPYIAFGVGGKRTLGDNKEDIEWDKEIDGFQYLTVKYYKRTDAGANFIAGYELNNKISFQLNAQLGLIKINPEIQNDNDDETSIKNTGFGFSVGYRF
jgi:hypothetical protein